MRVANRDVGPFVPVLVLLALGACTDPLQVVPVPDDRDTGGGATTQPVTVAIAGPSMVTAKGSYMWTAVPSAAGAADSYQWELLDPASGTRHTLGTARTQTRTVYANDDHFILKVTMTSPLGRPTATLSVYECIDRCGHVNTP